MTMYGGKQNLITVMAGEGQVDKGGFHSFGDELAALKAGTFPKRSNLMAERNTPELLCSLGLDNLPLLWGPTHLIETISPYNDALHHHGVSEEYVLNIADIIGNPCFIYDNDTGNTGRSQDSVTIMTGVIVPGGTLLVSIHTNGRGRYLDRIIDANYLTGVYGKRRNGVFGQLKRAIESERLLYINKGMTRRMFSCIRCNLPYGFEALPDKTILHLSVSAGNTKERPDEFNERYRKGIWNLETHFSRGRQFPEMISETCLL